MKRYSPYQKTNSALFHTLIENCTVHDLDPEAYFVEVIEALKDRTMMERADELTPPTFLRRQKKATSELKTT